MAKIQFGNKIYDTDNPQDNAELLRLQNIARQNKINAQRKRLAAKIQPNSNLMPEIQAKAAAELANLNGLQTARQFEGRNPAARNVEDIVLNRMPPKVDNSPASLLGITTPDVNINTNSLLPAQPVQSAQPQPKRTLGQRASGLFDRVSDAYMGAAPIFAVAQEFQKAGALRPIGSPMQGDPYGKMMEIQQGRQQAENLTNLRQDKRYEKFANLPDEQFLQAVNKQIKFDIENKLNVTPDQTIQTSRENAVVSKETEEALGRAKSAFGITDTFRENLGAVGEYVPFRERTFAPKTQAARQAVRMNVTKTKQFFLTDFAGRVAKYTAETINNILPMRFDAGSSQMTGFKSESFATNSYQNLKSEVERIVSVAESTLQNPNTTNKEKSDARSALSTGNQLIKEYDIILESLSGEREGTNENAGTEKRLYNVTQYDNKEPVENVRERFYTGGGLQIVAESRGLK